MRAAFMMRNKQMKRAGKMHRLRAGAAGGPLGWLQGGTLGHPLIHPHRPPGPTFWAEEGSRDHHRSSQVHEAP